MIEVKLSSITIYQNCFKITKITSNMSYQKCDIPTDEDQAIFTNEIQDVKNKSVLKPKISLLIALVFSVALSIFCYTRYVDPAFGEYALHPTLLIEKMLNPIGHKDPICAPQKKTLVLDT